MHCIMAIVEEVLCLTRTKRCSHEVAVVFLDLEKAFELVDHPVVVVRSLVKKGLLGKTPPIHGRIPGNKIGPSHLPG